jgi:hypothetical protein
VLFVLSFFYYCIWYLPVTTYLLYRISTSIIEL